MNWKDGFERIKGACKLLKDKAVELGLCDETATIDQVAPLLIQYIDSINVKD